MRPYTQHSCRGTARETFCIDNHAAIGDNKKTGFLSARDFPRNDRRIIMRKIIALILTAALLIAVLAACNGNNGTEDGDPTVSDTTTGGETDENYAPDIDADPDILQIVFEAFPPETVMATLGDFTLTWGELFFHIRGITFEFAAAGMLPELSTEVPGLDGITFAEFILDEATNSALMLKAIEYGAGTLGVTLSAADKASIQDDVHEYMEVMGIETMEAFAEDIWMFMGIYSIELFYYLSETFSLANSLFDEMFGPGGINLTDSELDELTADYGYLMAMHILRMRAEDDQGEAFAEAEEIYALLRAYDGDDFQAFFSEMMFEHSEDVGGLFSFPNGYLFQFGDMVPEFYEGTKALGFGEMSGIVATDFGYHIILRLPVNYNEVPISVSHMGGAPVRERVANEQFDRLLSAWLAQLDPQFTSDFDSIDLAEMFHPAYN